MAAKGQRRRTVGLFLGVALVALAVVGPARADQTFVLTGSLTTATGDPACGQVDVADPASGTSVGTPVLDGTFTLTVPAGDEVVTVTDGGCATVGLPAWSLGSFPLTVSADAPVDLALPSTIPLTLTVTDTSGSPVEGATVASTDAADAYDTAFGPLTPTQTLAGTTGADGTVVLPAFADADLGPLSISADTSAGPLAARVAHLELLGAKALPLTLGPAATPRLYAPPGAPTTVLAFSTGLVTAPKVRVSWLAPAATGGFPISQYVATADPGGAVVTSPPSLTSVLFAGLDLNTPYTFSVVATNAVGPGPASDPSAVVVPSVFDTTAPVPAMTGPVARVALGAAATVSWTATDQSGIGSYDLRWRTAHEDGVFGGYLTQAKLTGTTATSTSMKVTLGTTTCFSVRAKDRAGNVSGWTDDRCVTRPTDDSALAASAGWTVTAPSSAYNRTLSTGGVDATLTLDGTSFGQLTLVVNTCKTCGTVEVSVDGVVIGTMDTHSAGSKVVRKVLLTLVPTDGLPVHSGSVTLRSATSGRTVQIDGIALVAP